MENQYALITGASSGIGLQIAHQLAQKGFGIILTARREDRLRELSLELAEKYNVKTDFISSDLAEPNAPHEIYSFCKEKNYDVEVLVNNAGYGIESQFHKTSMEVEEKFIRVLGTSVIALCKAFIPDMLEKIRQDNDYIFSGFIHSTFINSSFIRAY